MAGLTRHLLWFFFRPFLLTGKDQRVKAKTIGPPHGLPKRLTIKSGSAFCEGKRKRPSVKVKRLVRPLGNRCPAFWPWPARPTRTVFGIPTHGTFSLGTLWASPPLPLRVIASEATRSINVRFVLDLLPTKKDKLISTNENGH